MNDGERTEIRALVDIRAIVDEMNAHIQETTAGAKSYEREKAILKMGGLEGILRMINDASKEKGDFLPRSFRYGELLVSLGLREFVYDRPGGWLSDGSQDVIYEADVAVIRAFLRGFDFAKSDEEV